MINLYLKQINWVIFGMSNYNELAPCYIKYYKTIYLAYGVVFPAYGYMHDYIEKMSYNIYVEFGNSPYEQPSLTFHNYHEIAMFESEALIDVNNLYRFTDNFIKWLEEN